MQEILLAKRNFHIAKISLGLRNFRYDCEIFAILAKFFAIIAKILVCSCFSALLLHHFLHFSFITLPSIILHSRLAEIDRRPYEIDGNQPGFGYDWIETIIWLPIPVKTTKTASECN